MAVNPLLVGGIGVGVTAAAIGGGLYAGGVIGGGTSISVSTEKQMPTKWKPASEDSDEQTSYGTGKYANKYKRYLVGEGTTGNVNDEWWTWSFNNRYEKKKTDKSGFKNLSDVTQLKNACKTAYMSEDSKIKKGASEEPTTDSEFKESDIWKYCSLSGTKIETLQDKNSNEHATGKYGGEANNKSDLVYAASATDNEWFWNLKQDELKASDNLSKSESKFKKLQEKLKANQKVEDSERKTVREICNDAYDQAITGTENTYPKEDIFKFCSISGKAPQG